MNGLPLDKGHAPGGPPAYAGAVQSGVGPGGGCRGTEAVQAADESPGLAMKRRTGPRFAVPLKEGTPSGTEPRVLFVCKLPRNAE